MAKGNAASRRWIGGLAPFITAGIEANGQRDFGVEMNGKDWYDLLRLLEDRASAVGPYHEVRRCVLFSELIRAQLQGQGF